MSPGIHPSLLERKIIHFDMDAFYAAVEVRDDPRLKGKPLVIGGSPNSRAVVCTASYEARRFGIRSAMPCSQAARLCRDVIFLRPNFSKYQAASQKIREVFKRYTNLIEPLSLDEAYLDVTSNAANLYATKIARLIQEEIRDELQLSGSAGVAPNKLVAKIASDVRKPGGLTVVLPEQVRGFMQELPLRKIHGIGPATEKRLLAEGLSHCADIWQIPEEELQQRLGKNLASWLWLRSQGIDERPVETDWVRKSLGQEETFAEDVLDLEKLRAELRTLCKSVAAELRERLLEGRTITVKVKYADFQQVTRSRSEPLPMQKEEEIFEIAQHLLAKTEAGRRKVRLLGVSLSNF